MLKYGKSLITNFVKSVPPLVNANGLFSTPASSVPPVFSEFPLKKHLFELIKNLSIENPCNPFSALTDVHRIYPNFCYGFLIRFSNLLPPFKCKIEAKFMKPFAQKTHGNEKVTRRVSLQTLRFGRKSSFCSENGQILQKKRCGNCVGSF